jgi:hypothetical protein
LIEIFTLDVQLDALIEKASTRALADIPTFGLRKTPAADVIFAELIGEVHTVQSSQKTLSSTQLASDASWQDMRSLLASDIYGSKPCLPSDLVTNICRVQNVLGKAVLHFAPVETAEPPRSSTDIFDTLLGLGQTVELSQLPQRKTSPEDVRVRLEYDNAIIAADTAAAYLARFQYHLESRNLAL